MVFLAEISSLYFPKNIVYTTYLKLFTILIECLPAIIAQCLSLINQGAVNLEFVLNYIKGSISCTATPFNESSVIIIWHQLAKSADNLLVWFPF